MEDFFNIPNRRIPWLKILAGGAGVTAGASAVTGAIWSSLAARAIEQDAYEKHNLVVQDLVAKNAEAIETLTVLFQNQNEDLLRQVNSLKREVTQTSEYRQLQGDIFQAQEQINLSNIAQAELRAKIDKLQKCEKYIWIDGDSWCSRR